jgi:acyl carrier protein
MILPHQWAWGPYGHYKGGLMMLTSKVRASGMATREQVEIRVRRILVERVGIPIDPLDGQARLVDDLEMDSLDFVDVALELQRQLEISIPHEELTRLGTVDEMVEFVLGMMVGSSRTSLRRPGG